MIAATGSVAEWAVAGGTLALAAATGWLALKAKGQVKVAAEHVVAIQRPLVSPVVTPEWDHLGRTQSRIVLKNVGLGPAYNVAGALFWTGGSGGASSVLTVALGPGEQTETRVAGEGITVNWDAAKGYLRYRDSGAEEWVTHFHFLSAPGVGLTVEVDEVGRISDLGEPAYNPEGRVR